LTGWLARLGNRSLGAMLFSHAGFKRGPMNFKRLDHRHALFESALRALRLADPMPHYLWARRSHFVFGVQAVLVSEVFSPTVLLLPATKKRADSGFGLYSQDPQPYNRPSVWGV
jgi:chorismate--pyruvate lyase